MCTEHLNENELYPGVTFETLDDHNCTLSAFGQRFHISFEMFIHHKHYALELAVLKVSNVTRAGTHECHETILRRYFDEFGNVRKALNGEADSFHPLHEVGFLNEFTNDLATAYLSKVEQTCSGAEAVE